MEFFLNHFQKFTELPKLYETLKDVALVCLDNIRFDADARKVFTTPRVREALNDAMVHSIKALECITIHLSKGTLSECIVLTSATMCSPTIRASRFERRGGEEPDG